MSSSKCEADLPAAGRAARMEAAAWIARLQGPQRSPELEAGFRRWLAESAGHRDAFEMANEVWGDLAAIPKSEHPIRVTFERPRLWSLAAAAVISVAVAAVFWFAHDPALTTKVGERRTLRLDDGSQVTLNTATRIGVDYDAGRRHLRLERGEALFEVVKDANRPFVVTTDGHEVIALGTSFVVRRNGADVAVTLLDGKVAVSTDPQIRDDGSFVLAPGQRVTLARHEPPRLDRPSLENVMAWQHGQVILDHTPLADAIAEINRYSEAKIVLQANAIAAAGDERRNAGSIPITGIFRAGEPEEFARAIATTYGLHLTEEPNRLVLSGLSR